MTIKIGINGFGRIGRAILRSIIEQELTNELQIVHINSSAKPNINFAELLAHLLTYDSVHGKLNAEISIQDENTLRVNNQVISLSKSLQPDKCPWGDLDVDIVFECTGKFCNKEKASLHLAAGASQVLLSAPGENADKTIVYGVNHLSLTKKDKIISNASCTTNCLAPLIQPLHQTFKIESGLMTTIHAYTSDQTLLDNNHSDLYRARAAALSMIPAKTGAAKAIGLVIPELAGKLTGQAVRVPVANVSLVDLTFTSSNSLSVEGINQCLIAAEHSYLHGVLATNNLPLVSSDFNHNRFSSIADLSQTLVLGNTAKVFAWYDNEWAFACRMLDTARHMAAVNE